MAQSGKGKLNYRCPMCFMRDLDIDMFYDKTRRNTTVSVVSMLDQRRTFWQRTSSSE